MTSNINGSYSALVFQTDAWLDIPNATATSSSYLALLDRVEQAAKPHIERTGNEPPAKRRKVETTNLPNANEDWLLCSELSDKETAKFSCVSDIDPKSGKKTIILERLDKEEYLYVKQLVLEKHENGFTSIFLDFDDYSVVSSLLFSEYKKAISPPYVSFDTLRITSVWESIKHLKTFNKENIFTQDQIMSVEKCLSEEDPFSGPKPVRKKGT